ncbi:hypothetical protein Hanom_Chr04g00382991 [Helianthus anomalus]
MRMVVDGGGLEIERWENLDVRKEWVGSGWMWEEKERVRVGDVCVWRSGGDMVVESLTVGFPG